MAVIEIAKIQVRRGQENTTGIPRLDPGEFGWAEDTQHLYIGKRISEGANTDENSRILTEIDLGEIQSLLGNASTVTNTSLYQYRTGTDYISNFSSIRPLIRKIDDLVSVKDFGAVGNGISNDTESFRKAITTLYNNPEAIDKTEPRRRLMIPAGNYIIEDTIDLPPYAQLIGEGQDVTTLISTMSSGNTFRTIDSLGVNFGGSMQDGPGSSRGIQISNMTLAYADGNTNVNALVSLDNTEDPKIQNVTFTTMGTSVFVNAGTGIDIQSNLGSDESSVVSKNSNIINCQFKSLYSGVNSRGLISRPIFENNVFMNLHQGVSFSLGSGVTGPTNVLITKNKFDFIQGDAINADEYSSPVISSDNVFYYVGNNSAIADDFVTSSAGPVITFNAPGNFSSNDYFNRKQVAVETGGFYYNPLVSGYARINSAATISKTLVIGGADQTVVLVPLTGGDQLGIIEYQLSNVDMSRKGRLTLNIAADGYASVSDYYNFSEVTHDSNKLVIFSTDLITGDGLNYIIVTCSNLSGLETILECNLDLVV